MGWISFVQHQICIFALTFFTVARGWHTNFVLLSALFCILAVQAALHLAQHLFIKLKEREYDNCLSHSEDSKGDRGVYVCVVIRVRDQG